MMLPPISSSGRGGWLSDETLARDMKRFNYGMRFQYIQACPPIYARKVEGIYTMKTPKLFLTRQQARFCASRRRPTEYQAGKPKATLMTKLIQPKVALQETTEALRSNNNNNNNENNNNGVIIKTSRTDESPEWIRGFQAGVWFWTNSLTGETTVSTPPGHVRRRESSRRKDDDEGEENAAGTGALVYDSTMYNDFTRLIGGGGGGGGG